MYMNKVLVEMPCVCKSQEYMNDGHRYNSEYYQGWVKIKQDKNGNTNFNDVDVHLYK